jgi:hypothetical protein
LEVLALLVSVDVFEVPDDGAGLAGELSVVGLGAAFVSVDVSLAPVDSFVSGVVVAETPFRLSVMYQPEPLKIIPTGWMTRRQGPPQLGQTCTGSSVTFWRRSNRFPQDPHSYS